MSERDICQQGRPDTLFRGIDCASRRVRSDYFAGRADQAREQYGDVPSSAANVKNPHSLLDSSRNQKASRYRIN